MEWFVRYEARANLDDHQVAELTGLSGIVSVQLTDNPAGGHWATVTASVEADDYDGALRKARQALWRRMLWASRIEAPYRVTVEQADAPTGHPLLSTAAVAARLGVSDARVRQLAQREDFPRALDIPGLAGAVYSAAAVDAWAATWDREAKGGRPRAGL